MRRCLIRLSLLLCGVGLAQAQPAALSVNPESREEVRQFYRTVYFASEQAAMDWSGNYTPGTAGSTSAAYQEATRLRINFFRALAGVPADITFNASFSAKAQQAALLMSVNDALSHSPPVTWNLYNAVAAEAAYNSNLALGQAGPAAIDGYIADHGDNNAVVGHRRWLLYPQTLQMGSGDVPGLAGSTSLRPANAVWVIDTTPGGQYGAPRPATRATAVTYPPAGFVPYRLVWPRWSFSYPGADFAAATVAMTRDGQPINATLEPVGTNLGEPTLVWIYDNRDPSVTTPHVLPAADTVYNVTINNVRIGGTARNFTYRVTVFDPEKPGADFVPVTIRGASAPALAAANTYTLTKPSFANGFDWRTLQLSPANVTFTAENGLEGLVPATTAGYEVVQATTAANGRRAYRLAHLDPRSDQVLLLPDTYLAGNDAAITFRSRLAIATATETARVQVSTDDGLSWNDVFAQAGTSPTNTGFPTSTESGYIARRIPLGDYAGRTIGVRLVYSVGFGSAFIPESGNLVGWFIDDLAVTGVQNVAAAAATRVPGGSTFMFAPATTSAVALQARGVMFGAYPMEWGPVATLDSIQSDPAPSHSYLSNLSVRTGAGTGPQTLIVGFSVSGGNKPLLVRGIGPALTSFGVAGALSDPKLELYRETAQISANDNWLAADSPTFTGVGAFGLANGSKDAAMVVSVGPSSYTAQVSGANGGTGIALVELYDTAGDTSPARLVNVSARSQVGTGSNILIAGFSVAGTGPKKLLIRAVGPSLEAFGVSGTLADPKLELYGSAGKLVENDNWDPSVAGTFAQIGAFALTSGSRDAVLLVTLPPGNYTAQVSGVGGTTGVALVELYEIP
ncbi:CAP domain-containing protein [Horticoccus sp. 23ND18S-11]|uniref:CAP domain-containing protein n=1 Tax=Horticoccus sp. 23ND18S-11 TaxID=3391832 RepID=UPI0039C9A891